MKSKLKLKGLTLFVALIASIMLVFGGIFWILGVALLVISLSIRFIIAISPDRAGTKLRQAKRGRAGVDVLSQAERIYSEYMDARRSLAEAYRESAGKVEPFESRKKAEISKSKVRTLISHLPGETVTSYLARPVNITVIGIGGGGCNFITNMAEKQISGIKLVAMNTDKDALKRTVADVRVQLGPKTAFGLGVSGDYDKGRRAAEESHNDIVNAVEGADMVIIVLGMGGGTGTGAAPIVGEISRKIGALTIGIATSPFTFEGEVRIKTADRGIMQLLNVMDTLVIIPNDKILEMIEDSTKVEDAFRMVDEAVFECVQAMSEVVTVPGLINLDFLDLKAILKDAGPAWMSIGEGSGRNRATIAAKKAVSSPLMDVSLTNSKNLLFNFSAGSGLTLFEVNEATEIIKKEVDPEANIIFGVTHNPEMGNKVKIILIATGFISVPRVREKRQIDRIPLSTEDLKKIEDMVDIPSFLRRPLFNHRRRRSDRSESSEKRKT